MTAPAVQDDDRWVSLLNSRRTLIVGRNGRLATAFRYLFPQANVVGRREVDIADFASVMHVVGLGSPGLIINCAAITDLALCEQDPAGTRQVNVTGVANLARASSAAGATLIHFSSDYAAHPVNEYGRSKLESERYADLTIRAKIYDASHWAWDALRSGRTVPMTTSEFSNPISTTGVASLLPVFLQKGLRGVVPLGSRERMSFYQIGRTWASALGVPAELVEPTGPITSPYARPADTFMAVDALVDAGIAVPLLASDAEDHRAHFAKYGDSSLSGVWKPLERRG